MTKSHLQVVRPIDPKQKRSTIETERHRVKKIYADICLQEHIKDKTDIASYARDYSNFPSTAYDIYEAVLLVFPNNVMCRAHDCLGITGIITNILRTRSDLYLKDRSKSGGQYDLSPIPTPPEPVQKNMARVKEISPMHSSKKTRTLEDRVTSLEGRFDTFERKVDQKLDSLREIVLSIKG